VIRERAVLLGDLTPEVTRRPDGAVLLRAIQPLAAYPSRATEPLAHWARTAPGRVLLAWHGGSLTYGDAWTSVRALGQVLIDRQLSAERPLVILSGNDCEHLLLALAAQHVGVPYAPISPAYSLVSTDFGLLKHAFALLTPGLIYASDRGPFARALGAVAPAGVEVMHRDALATLLAVRASNDVDRAHLAITPDTVAKILLTSGSTGVPKGVINTHRMLCSNQQMIRQALPCLAETPPILVDWLPWHHTFGGNHNIGLVMFNGGTLHLDNGRPLPGAFDESVRNLRETAPTIYLNVPRGYEELVKALRADRGLAAHFFSRLQLLFYAAASLSQHVSDEMHALAEDTIGERLVFVTGLGATETAPMAICRPWSTPLASAIGLPVPGLELKLAPVSDKLEVRVRGANVTPGYWREPALTEAAFDDEGFYRMGDAARFVDRDHPERGLIFDGRIAEDFKLASGTWVNVGPLRARVIAHGTPLVRDAVITGHDRGEVGVLAVPDVAACRCLCPDLPADAAASLVLADPRVRAEISARLADCAAQGTGSATRITRAIVLDEPLSLDAGEVTDKGSLNQRVILTRRAAVVDELYGDPSSPRVLTGWSRPIQ
jgi:feruloyl-CoA synthase